jgi:hypothetical protein
MPLSEHLKSWRAERPDEWTMDEFIRKAERLERLASEVADGNFNQANVIKEAKSLIKD